MYGLVLGLLWIVLLLPVFEQFVLAELLDNGDFERHINRVRRKRRQNMR